MRDALRGTSDLAGSFEDEVTLHLGALGLLHAEAANSHQRGRFPFDRPRGRLLDPR
jgi:hypothetical protein